MNFEKNTKDLIDNLKSICADYGLGNDGNEFKIITQTFLYKFLNDKFIYEIKKIDKKLAGSQNLEKDLKKYSKNDYEMLILQLNENTAQLKPEHFISSLFERQNDPNFDQIFDNTLLDIAKNNNEIFSIATDGGEKIILFENISKYVTDRRDDFCRAIINKLINFSFEGIFHQKFDFYATIFEYLIKDYNNNSGSTYAEYFTPHAVAKIMASCLVTEKVNNATCYDPSAGSGTLLMNLAHAIGEDKCIIYSQDISQKSTSLLRLNLILNDLVHSIPNVIKGNTILDPYHKDSSDKLKKFDFIVSNPPFKLDFSGYISELDSKENKERFFAGFPNIPKKEKDKMAIYPLFIQHIIYSLKPKGRAAIVVPTGFLTSTNSIEFKIRKHIIDRKMLKGVISMPSNIFATTGTNVSVLFLNNNENKDSLLIDASKLGTTIKEDKKQKTLLSEDESKLIISTFNKSEDIDDFSTKVSYEKIIKSNYSFSAGQYFELKIKYIDITPKEMKYKIGEFDEKLTKLFEDSKTKEKEIKEIFKNLNNTLDEK